ncbi:hypothetical protein EJ04DRAFT_509083 [Polyplosphaeria fusca]|uniref:Uncharacterized protein n=1 Tax=Polyplosphaeria fusca TaxID=682080 RepID=A0A9P4R6D1_9PLEO|nr:hypothetical protein EJ04DRAFT_509083 [Polyplosphaeria fusca]
MNKKRKVDESLMKLDAVQELRREKARDIEHLGNLDQQRLELLEKIKTGEEVIEKELRGIPEEHVRAWFKNLVHDG